MSMSIEYLRNCRFRFYALPTGAASRIIASCRPQARLDDNPRARQAKTRENTQPEETTMKGIRRGNLVGWFSLAVLVVCGSYAHAQGYPSRPIEFVAHTSPGSGTDLFGRNVTNLLEKEKLLSQAITHSNRTGGLGAVAFNYIKSKRGDPHVVLIVATGSMLNAASRPELELPLSTFTPLAFFAQDPQAIAVRVESKVRTISP
jgi:hypothetical protein